VGKRSVLRFSEKRGKEKEIPVRHRLDEILDRYLHAAGLRDQPDSPLFLAARGNTRESTDRGIDRVAAWMMVKRLAKGCLPADDLFEPFFP
jgi:integrase/recombinase XerD